METNLREHRINTIAEYEETVRVLNDSQKKYYGALKKMLDGMRPGTTFDIPANIPGNLRRLFVKCVCIYILRDLSGSVDFSEDYNIVRKRY